MKADGDSVRAFLGWCVVGAGACLGVLSLLTIGPFVLLLTLMLAGLMLWRVDFGWAMAGMVSGAAAPVLYVAWLNRGGPGSVCDVLGRRWPELHRCVEPVALPGRRRAAGDRRRRGVRPTAPALTPRSYARGVSASWFATPTEAAERLGAAGYLADTATGTTAYLAGALEKPLLVEGPAGVGKTELAKAVARATGAELVRLQCYEGLDEARALYEWNYKKQLLRIQAAGDQTWEQTHDDVFTEEFLLTRPLLTAIRRDEPTVLLVDEVDKTDVEVEGLLLEILSDFQVTIPELGTLAAVRRPFVVLTSNASRELSEALKRRCLYLHLDYPDAERERAIIRGQVPGLDDRIARQVVETVGRLRELELKKSPSIAESIDWARTLVALEIGDLDEAAAARTLGVVLKHASDHERAIKELRLG